MARPQHPIRSAFVTSVALSLIVAQTAQAVAGTVGIKMEDRDNGPGIIIDDIAPYSPAAQAGLHFGDILLKINGSPVNVMDEVTAIIKNLGSRRADLLFDRDGILYTTSLTPVEAIFYKVFTADMICSTGNGGSEWRNVSFTVREPWLDENPILKERDRLAREGCVMPDYIEQSFTDILQESQRRGSSFVDLTTTAYPSPPTTGQREASTRQNTTPPPASGLTPGQIGGGIVAAIGAYCLIFGCGDSSSNGTSEYSSGSTSSDMQDYLEHQQNRQQEMETDNQPSDDGYSAPAISPFYDTQRGWGGQE